MLPDRTAARTAAPLFFVAVFHPGSAQVISSGSVCCHLPVSSCLETAFSDSFSAHQRDSFLTIQISQTPVFGVFY